MRSSCLAERHQRRHAPPAPGSRPGSPTERARSDAKDGTTDAGGQSLQGSLIGAPLMQRLRLKGAADGGLLEERRQLAGDGGLAGALGSSR